MKYNNNQKKVYCIFLQLNIITLVQKIFTYWHIGTDENNIPQQIILIIFNI